MLHVRPIPSLMVHVVAASLALWFAWHVSQSPFAKSGVQFIGPLLVVMAVHFGAMALSGNMNRGYPLVIYAQSAKTALAMLVTLFVATLVAPAPAWAQGNEVVGVALMVVFCVLMIVVIVGVCALLGYLLFKGIYAVIDAVKKDKPDEDDRFLDGGSMIAATLVLGTLSLEGLPQTYAFDGHGQGQATFEIMAPPDVVWDTMQTATSPTFPLPAILSSFPQPVAVETDEGTGLGAKRVVAFAGREGAGKLKLQVVDQSEMHAVFQVTSDTTPYRQWLAFEALRYDLEDTGSGTRLSVSIAFERKLAPAWFFDPAMQQAANLAAAVLVSDVKTRAEAGL